MHKIEIVQLQNLVMSKKGSTFALEFETCFDVQNYNKFLTSANYGKEKFILSAFCSLFTIKRNMRVRGGIQWHLWRAGVLGV